MAKGNKRPSKMIPLDDLQLSPIKPRGLMQSTCEKYGYYIGQYNGKPVQVACYFKDGEMVGQKLRFADKTFSCLGSLPDTFYGQHLFPGGGKKLLVVEGEIDAMSGSQMQGNKYPVVSIPKGANSAKKTFQNNLAWLESFEEVITMFDQDDVGREATKEVQGLLSPGKLKVAVLPLKDANDMLVNGRTEEFNRALWAAETYRPDGIVKGVDLFDRIEQQVHLEKGLPMPWDLPANDMLAGLRGSEFTLVTAGSGIGKSTFTRAIAHYFGTKLNQKVGYIALEEKPEQTALHLMSCTAQKPLHLVGEELSAEERKAIFEETLGSDNFVFYDHFGSTEGDNLVNQIRYLAVAEGCKYVVLDHISMAVSGLEGDNERKMIDVLMTKLVALTQETGVGIIAISHLKKAEGKTKHEEGAQISLDDLRGSGGLKQLSFNVIALERNQQAEDERARNLICVRVLKCRHTGRTGPGGYLLFDNDTHTFSVVKDVEQYLGAESPAEADGFSFPRKGDEEPAF